MNQVLFLDMTLFSLFPDDLLYDTTLSMIDHFVKRPCTVWEKASFLWWEELQTLSLYTRAHRSSHTCVGPIEKTMLRVRPQKHKAEIKSTHKPHVLFRDTFSWRYATRKLLITWHQKVKEFKSSYEPSGPPDRVLIYVFCRMKRLVVFLSPSLP